MRVDALTDLSALIMLPLHGAEVEDIPLGEGGLHAGEWETSLLLASHPETVHMDRAEPGFVGSRKMPWERSSTPASTPSPPTG